MEKEKLTEVITIRCTATEKAIIKHLAWTKRGTISGLFRQFVKKLSTQRVTK